MSFQLVPVTKLLVAMNQNDQRYPGLFTGLIAFALAVRGFALSGRLFPARLSLPDAVVAGGIVGCFPLGVGIGHDSSVHADEAQRLSGVGCLFLLLAYTGSATGIRPLFLIPVAPGFLPQGIHLGRQAQ